MVRIFFYFCCILLISNCSMPTTALLGPIITGATTGSVSQTSLSYVSNKMLNDYKSKKKELVSNTKLIETFFPYNDKGSVVLSTQKIDKVIISDVLEQSHFLKINVNNRKFIDKFSIITCYKIERNQILFYAVEGD